MRQVARSPLGNADLISLRNVLASVRRVNNKQPTGMTRTPRLQSDLRGRVCTLFVWSRLTADSMSATCEGFVTLSCGASTP